MSIPRKSWEMNSLQNSTQIAKSTMSATNFSGAQPMSNGTRSAPVPPPLPRSSPAVANNYNSFMPNGGINNYMVGGYGGYGGGYGGYSGGYGGYGGYGNYGMPYRNTLYNTYGGYNGMYGDYPPSYPDDAERRFIQFAEESSRHTFASVENIVRAFNSISMMLDNTFFAMTSSFRAVLSVAENFGRLRSMFGQIWYSISIFRLFNWLYRKLMWLIGVKLPNNPTSLAWREATKETSTSLASSPSSNGSSWPTLAFLGVLVSAPYIISKFLPKYEDKTNPMNWKSPGIRAKAAFDFVARSPNELSFTTNDELTLAPTYIQEEMNLKNTGWAFAVANNERVGVVPLNYLVTLKTPPALPTQPIENNMNKTTPPPPLTTTGLVPEIKNSTKQTKTQIQTPIQSVEKNNNNSNSSSIKIDKNNNTKVVDEIESKPINSTNHHKSKRVSFGENQIFENVDLDDYFNEKKELEESSKIDDTKNKIHENVDVEENISKGENSSNK